MDRNPFRFATPLSDPDYLVGRDEILERLEELAASGTYVMVEGPRRFGKTSLIKACVRRWQAGGGLAAWVDFSQVLTPAEAGRRLEQSLGAAAHSGVQEVIEELLRSVRVRLGPFELGGVPAPGAVTDPSARLHELLEVAAEAAQRSEHRSLVCLDEFQDVLGVQGLDGILRSHLQHHADSVSYIFCGSEPSLLRSLFSDRTRPLYAQAKPLRVGRVAPQLLAERIMRSFAARDVVADEAAERVAVLGAGHPQRTMLLAWHLWDQASGRRAARAEDADSALAAALEDSRPELEATWRGMAGNERRVAVALALALTPLGKDARAATGLASASSAQTALRSLQDSGVVERTPSSLVLTDPLLAIWLALGHGA